MKKFGMTGFAVCGVLFVLGFSSCDATLDPSDTGDSALSKPRGELTISGIDSGVYQVSVYSTSVTMEALKKPSSLDWVARGTPVSSSETITLGNPAGNVWDGTGEFLVFLEGSSETDIMGYAKVISFDKGRASVVFFTFEKIETGKDEDD
jgi:hypothetical protein